MSGSDEVNGVGTELQPTKYLKEKLSEAKIGTANLDESVALIILHSPIDHYEYFSRLYYHASFRLCADGAANRLHDMLVTRCPTLDWKDALRSALPDIIHGDLDSINEKVRTRYEQLDVETSEDPDQYSTDFEKAVEKVIERVPDVRDILVLGSLGGRIDHGLGLLGDLYREQRFRHPDLRFWLFSEANVSTILQPGVTTLHTPVKEGLITRNVGILPTFGPAKVTLNGFEWDVQDWPTEIGGQMSTSNHIVADCITVTTDNYVLFTVERTVEP